MRHAHTLKAPLLLSLIATVQEGCGVPGPNMDPSVLADLERVEHAFTTVAGESIGVSTLRSTSHEPGAGRVIYVHGTPGDATNWLDYLHEPVAGWEAVALDRPGFGQSGPKRGAVESLEDQARALEPLLAFPGEAGPRPVLVGHSLGGPVVAKAAALFPERIGGVVILAGSLDPALEKVLAVQHFGDWGIVRWALPRWARNANRELIDLRGELETLAGELDRITAPVVVVHGTRDSLVPFENVAYMRARFGGLSARGLEVEFVTLDGGNHFLIWNQAERVREAIRSAIERAEARAVPPRPSQDDSPASRSSATRSRTEATKAWARSES